MLFTSLFSLFLWAGIRWSRTVEFGSTTRGQQTPSKFWFWVSTFSLTDSAWSEWERGTFTSWSGLVCELPTWKYTFLFHRQTDHHPRRFRICKDIQNKLCHCGRSQRSPAVVSRALLCFRTETCALFAWAYQRLWNDMLNWIVLLRNLMWMSVDYIKDVRTDFALFVPVLFGQITRFDVWIRSWF